MPDTTKEKSASDSPILLNPEHKEIHAAVGAGVDAYSHLEGAQSMLLEAILGTSPRMAAVLFFTVQNVRARNEMIQTMLSLKYGDKYEEFWNKCTAFLQPLATFRNALVHWQPVVTLYQNKQGKVVRHAHELGHPTAGMDFSSIKADDIPKFIGDCRYIEQQILALSLQLKGELPEHASPDRFRKPNIRRNLAVLQPRQKPKGLRRLRSPSQPSKPQKNTKLSAKQRRIRALKMAAKKKRAT